jgi:hypothetical protein
MKDVITEERHDLYIWIIRSMVEIESHVLLLNIKFIFADQKSTPTVLVVCDLGIESSCTLHGDFYHLLYKVWPQQFHSSIYPQLRTFLSAMLLSNTREEWNSSYPCASVLAQSTPWNASALNVIYTRIIISYAGLLPPKYQG